MHARITLWIGGSNGVANALAAQESSWSQVSKLVKLVKTSPVADLHQGLSDLFIWDPKGGQIVQRTVWDTGICDSQIM